jgi:hypothetical protein
MGVTGTRLEPSPVNVRIKISALWMSMLFVFAYVDLFSLYRSAFRADVEAGEVGGFAVNQTFLLATTAYVVIPSLMVFCVLACGRGSTESSTSPWPSCTRSASSPQPSASGLTTSWAASSRRPCSRPSSSTHGPGQRRLARWPESSKPQNWRLIKDAGRVCSAVLTAHLRAAALKRGPVLTALSRPY